MLSPHSFSLLFEVPAGMQLTQWGAGLVLAGLLTYGVHRLLLRHQERQQRQTRSFIAANLHDELGSVLMRLHMQAETMLSQDSGHNSGLQQLLATIQAATSAMRDVVWGLDASADNVGALQDRMRDLLDQLRLSTSLHITFTTDGLEGIEKLPNPVRQEMYLVFKEATTNVLRHAEGASYLAARLYRQKNSLVLEVEDDGTSTTWPGRSGMGLRNMALRAQKVGGKLEARPRPDSPGFRVYFCAPLAGQCWP